LKKQIIIIGIILILIAVGLSGCEETPKERPNILIDTPRMNCIYNETNNSLVVHSVSVDGLIPPQKDLLYEDIYFTKIWVDERFYVQQNMTLGDNNTKIKTGPVQIGDEIYLSSTVQTLLISYYFEPYGSLLSHDVVPGISGEPSKVDDTKWILESYINRHGDFVDLLPNSEITLNFNNSEVLGSDSCNSYWGYYITNNSNISFFSFVHTMIYCRSLEEQNEDYFSALSSISKFEIKDNKLVMTNSNGEVALEYRLTS